MGLLAVNLISSASCFVPHSPLRFQAKRSIQPVLKAAFQSSEKMDSGGQVAPVSKLMEFPHLTASHRDLMVDLIETVENGLGDHLLPSTVPTDVEYYENQNGTSQGTLLIRSALPSSPVNSFLSIPSEIGKTSWFLLFPISTFFFFTIQKTHFCLTYIYFNFCFQNNSFLKLNM